MDSLRSFIHILGSGRASVEVDETRRNHTQKTGENSQTGLAQRKALGSTNQRGGFSRAADSTGGRNPRASFLRCRRKWATERKHPPVMDVAQAGRWSNIQTLLMCYQQPDHETLLAVVSESRKVRERGVG